MSRALTSDELLFIVRVQHDTITALLDQVADAQRRIAEAFQDGHAVGEWAGELRGAEEMGREMAEWFAAVVRLARQRAGHPSYAERAAADAEWVKPRPGDYTGQLSEAEYFGTAGEQQQQPDTSNVHPLERRHAA